MSQLSDDELVEMVATNRHPDELPTDELIRRLFTIDDEPLDIVLALYGRLGSAALAGVLKAAKAQRGES